MTRVRWDISDYLSPILVKELRQGLRERSFVISFLSLQGGLAFLMLIGVASQGDPASLVDQSYWFQGVLGAIFMVVMPLRGIMSLSEELKQNTLETVMLTRLSAWSIAFGKWTALVFQGFLIGSAVLPYLIMRFLLGGEEIITNMTWLLIFFWAFLLLSLGTVSISAIRLAFVRISSLIAFAIAAIASAVSLSFATFSNSEAVVWGLVYLAFAPLIVFDLVSASIAPAAENRTWQRRLKAMLFLGISLILILTWDQRNEPLDLGLSLFTGLCFLEIAQTTVVLRRHVELFVKYGPLGRLALLFGLPGWQSGLMYAMVTLPLAFIASSDYMYPQPIPDDIGLRIAAFLVSCLGSALVPLLMSLAFPKFLTARAFLFICYNAALAGLLYLIKAGLEAELGRATDILAFIPSVPTLFESSDIVSSVDYGGDSRFDFVLKGASVDLILLSVVTVCGTNWIQDLAAVWPRQVKPEQPRLESARAKAEPVLELPKTEQVVVEEVK